MVKITRNKFSKFENLDNKPMEQMAKDGVYKFLWIFVPVPFAGATGSPGDAIAVH